MEGREVKKKDVILWAWWELCVVAKISPSDSPKI